MSQELDRDNIIRLLNQLGSDNDEEIMTSARALHAQVSDANVDWNDLLVGQTEADPIAEEDEIEEEDTSEESNNGEELRRYTFSNSTNINSNS